MQAPGENAGAEPADDAVTALFNLSFGLIDEKPMVDLTREQQRRQMSKPFEKHGMHWILTVEKEVTLEGSCAFNVIVILYCLSVALGTEEDREEKFPIKGTIPITQLARDGQVRHFNARTGVACNLVGKQFPADCVRMEKFFLSLRSGSIETDETEISMFEKELGGYYGADWRGAGGVVLENHIADPVRDGAAIEVMLRFEKKPRAMIYVD